MLKLRKRLTLISLSTANNLVVPVINVLLSLIIIRFCGTGVWGSMVQLLLWVGIATNIMAWGNKDFLLKQFSLSPSTAAGEWQKSLGSRSILLLFAIAALVFFPIEIGLKTWLSVFLLARFIYMSYDSLVIYKRKFVFTIIAETFGFLIIVSGIYFFGVKDFTLLFIFFTIAEVIKTIMAIIYFSTDSLPILFKHYDKTYFLTAFSFFILYFSGMLASKVDLLCGVYYLSKSDIARYQVLMNFFQLAQVGALFILTPYVKNIYRLSNVSAKKISAKFFLTGIPLSIIVIIAIKILVEYIYGIHFANCAYLLGALFIIPSFYTTFTFYRIVKQKGQNQIILLSFFYSVCGAILILTAFKIFGVSIYVILGAMTVAEWIQFLGYYFLFNKKMATP